MRKMFPLHSVTTEMVLTTRLVVLPHPGLYHVGLDRVNHSHLVVVSDGEAPATLQVQEGVGGL